MNRTRRTLTKDPMNSLTDRKKQAWELREQYLFDRNW